MSNNKHFDIIIVGGGLAGLCAALHLSKGNLKIALIEKQKYPHHKVCGEYVSNEVLPYLNYLGVNPVMSGAAEISEFQLSNHQGQCINTSLPLGGFGMSRYCLDQLLFDALPANVTVFQDTVTELTFTNDSFTVLTLSGVNFYANFVVGAFGKRSNIDKQLARPFIQRKSNWLAVKAHYEYDMPSDLVALHNFEGGYCGLSKVENGAVNACYLTTYKSFRQCSDIETFQKKKLSKNPKLHHFFENAQMIFEKPLTISQINFDEKELINDHVIMVGDSAGLIHPLCGNGMAMAIHSAKLFSEIFLNEYSAAVYNRASIETNYKTAWAETFSRRLRMGRRIQKLLLNPQTTKLAFPFAKLMPSIVTSVVKRTHGKPLLVNDQF